MIFTSLSYILFFPLVVLLFWIIPDRLKYKYLLVVSYLFYINIMPVYAMLLACVTCTTWFMTVLIDKAYDDRKKRGYLFLNIIFVLSPLFFFKYYSSINMALESIFDIYHLRWPMPKMELILPIGISYYTFVAIGYTVDVYNEEIKVEKNIGMVALFLSFFPLILSGPIERAKNILPQFRTFRRFDPDMMIPGLRFMLWGYFMKLVVADRLGIYVDSIYNNIIHHNGITIVTASILYPFQVYADLGGYSLIAIGTSKLLGINVIQNFKRPFFATSMAELWRRWHISLISWLTDYIYTPLNYTLRRYKKKGVIIALLVTFFISGMWHGAAITFVVWGLLQGVMLSIEALTIRRKTLFENKHNLKTKWWYIAINIIITFILFTSSLIFSRSASISDAIQVYDKILSMNGYLFTGSIATLIYGLIGITMILIKDFRDEYFPNSCLLFNNRFIIIRFMSYISIIIIIAMFGVFDGGQFIYFQF